MLPAVDPEAIYEFSLPDDTDNPTVFLLKALPSRHKGRVIAMARNAAGAESISLGIDGMVYALTHGLVGWRNWETPWSDNDQDRNIDSLPDDAFALIGQRIMELSGLGVAQQKK